MRFFICLACLIFIPLSFFAQESKKLSLQDAFSLALENNYDIQNQRAALASARGQYRQVKGAFDIEAGAQAQYSRTQNPVDEDDPNYHVDSTVGADFIDLGNTISEQTGGTIFLKKLFSFGLETKLSYTVQQTKNSPDYTYGSKFYDAGLSKLDDEKARNKGEISLELSLPLFKSFKNSLTSLRLDMAKNYIEQMEFSLEDTISKSMINVSQLYWNYFLAYKFLEQLENLQKKIEERNDNMDSLIRAGVRTKNDLLALEVNTHENRRQLQDAKVQCNKAKIELVTVLGISDTSKIGLPENPFSEIDLKSIQIPNSGELTEDFISSVLENRNDLKYLKQGVEMADLKVRLAKADRLPDANLNFGIGASGATYSDNTDQFLSSGFKNNHGVNVSGAVGVSAKIGNNEKKGAFDQAQAEYDKALIEYNKAKNTLALQIQSAAEKLAIYKNLVQGADSVLDLQKNLYENEQKRFNAGLITVDNLLQQDQKHISAENSYYQVLVNYLQAILEFKYYTASIVSVE